MGTYTGLVCDGDGGPVAAEPVFRELRFVWEGLLDDEGMWPEEPARSKARDIRDEMLDVEEANWGLLMFRDPAKPVTT